MRIGRDYCDMCDIEILCVEVYRYLYFGNIVFFYIKFILFEVYKFIFVVNSGWFV